MIYLNLKQKEAKINQTDADRATRTRTGSCYIYVCIL